jgi:hypothetical protein
MNAGQHEQQQQVFDSFVSVLRSSGLSATIQDVMLERMEVSIPKLKHLTRKVLKAIAMNKVFMAEKAAGKHPFPAPATRLHITPHTFHKSSDEACTAELKALHEKYLQDAADIVEKHKAAGISSLQAEITELRAVKGPADLATAFNNAVANSSHAQDPAVQAMLLHGKQLLELEFSNV